MKNIYKIKESKFFRRVLPIAVATVISSVGFFAKAQPIGYKFGSDIVIDLKTLTIPNAGFQRVVCINNDPSRLVFNGATASLVNDTIGVTGSVTKPWTTWLGVSIWRLYFGQNAPNFVTNISGEQDHLKVSVPSGKYLMSMKYEFSLTVAGDPNVYKPTLELCSYVQGQVDTFASHYNAPNVGDLVPFNSGTLLFKDMNKIFEVKNNAFEFNFELRVSSVSPAVREGNTIIGSFKIKEIIFTPLLEDLYSIQPFCAGDSVTVEAEIEDKKPELTYKYQWYKNDGILLGAKDSVYGYFPQDNDSLYCKVWIDGECSDTTKTNLIILKSNPIPIPPIVSTPYQVCSGITMMLSEVSVQGTNIKWYGSNARDLVIPSATSLTNDIVYYATQTVNGCESDQSYVKFSVVAPTELDSLQIVSPQTLCSGGTYHISDILLSPGTTAVWYDQSVGGTPLASTDPLTLGTTYYAARLVGSCESTKRTPVLISIGDPDFSSTTDTQYFCQGAMIKDIRMPIDHIRWYKSQTSTEPLDVAFVLEHDSNYYAEIDIDGAGTCTSNARMEVNIKIEPSNYKYALDTQAFAAGAKVMDIVASGYGLKWYEDKDLTRPLDLDDPLQNDSTYYAVSSTNTCGIISIAVTARLGSTVKLILKVFLEGPTKVSDGGSPYGVEIEHAAPAAGTTYMPNYIQEADLWGMYSYFTLPRLPVVNPYYAGGMQYSQINDNPSSPAGKYGPAGTVVDWVWVEIWGTVDTIARTKNLLDSVALLLKPDGSVVDTTGEPYNFKPQTEKIRIIVKHRNHLSVMSDSVFNFTAGAEIEYDFSQGLKKAFGFKSDPAPMLLKNGKWCMIAGDINRDGIIDNEDMNLLNFDIKTPTSNYDDYFRSDVDMNGGLETIDVSVVNLNYQKGSISPIIYFW